MRRGLKLGGRLDRYVGTLFVSSFATAFFVLVGLFLIVDMASHLDDYMERWKDGSSAPVFYVARYYLLQIPFVFLQLAPFVTLVAGLFSASKLLKHNEVTAALSAGVSLHRILAPMFLGALLCGGGMFVLREGASVLARQRDQLKYVLENQKYDEVYSELWLRTLDESVVHISEYRPNVGSPPAPEARGVQKIPLKGGRWSTTEATRAVYQERDGHLAWWLENGRRRQVSSVESSQPVDRLESSDFTPELVLARHRASENPMELSFTEARELARRDPDNVVYQTVVQYDITHSLANLVLLLVGLPIILRADRSKSTERLALGCLLCIFYFASNFVLTNLGLQGGIDPNRAAWLPILFFGSLGLAMFASMKS